MRVIKLGSLFDGSGGFPLAGALFGVEPVWASEIEPFPIRVTKQRFPKMKHLGSVTEIDGAAIEPVDIITFGSPCQDLSNAGKKAGINAGQRSSLFFEAIRIIKEMRNATENRCPRFAVFENVIGAFSSNNGEDFLAILKAFCSINEPDVFIPKPEGGRLGFAGSIVGDGYSLAWRVYDAQFWGVPQRRKRIYLISDFRSERAGQILFESESMPGHSEPCGAPWRRYSGNTEESAGRNSLAFAWANSAGAGLSVDEMAPTIKANRNGEPAAVYDARGKGDGKICPTLTGDHERRVSDYTALVTYVQPSFGKIKESDKANALKASDGKRVDPGSIVLQGDKGKSGKYVLRRMTPKECGRLQGFPDWWCDGVKGSDSAQYKMWGNGIALPCAADVIGRIVKEINKGERE